MCNSSRPLRACLCSASTLAQDSRALSCRPACARSQHVAWPERCAAAVDAGCTAHTESKLLPPAKQCAAALDIACTEHIEHARLGPAGRCAATACSCWAAHAKLPRTERCAAARDTGCNGDNYPRRSAMNWEISGRSRDCSIARTAAHTNPAAATSWAMRSCRRASHRDAELPRWRMTRTQLCADR